MYGVKMSDADKIVQQSKIINNLLPPYQKGDTLYFREYRAEATFCYFSFNDEGEVFCVLQPVYEVKSGVVHDFFSACVIPLDQVYTSRESRQSKEDAE